MSESPKTSRAAKRICAIYTRKSSEEGDGGSILDAFDGEADIGSADRLIEAGRQIAEESWRSGAAEDQSDPRWLQCRVDVGVARLDVTFARSRLAELLEGTIDFETRRGAQTPARDDPLTLSSPVALKRGGREMRMLVEGAADQAAPDQSLLRILARAHHVQARLSQNPTLGLRKIAHDESVTAPHLYSILRLCWLAPDITTAIVNGRQPPQLTAKSLMRLLPRLPADWIEQRRLLGFRDRTVWASRREPTPAS